MKQIDLNGTWTLKGENVCCSGSVPGSVYSFLLGNRLMEDPHFGLNEENSIVKAISGDFNGTKVTV